jgi:hypothetical protein
VSSYSAAAAAIYGAYAASVGRAGARWGDKNNFHTHHVAAIHEIFPEALFLHLVRDGRDVAVSYRGLARRQLDGPYAPRLPLEIGAIASQWSEGFRVASAALSRLNPGAVALVRFEDLVTDPEHTLTRVCAFIGEKFESSMLSFHQRNRELNLEPPSFLAWKQRSLEPPDPELVGVHRRELTPAELDAFEAVAAAELRQAGYTLHAQRA